MRVFGFYGAGFAAESLIFRIVAGAKAVVGSGIRMRQPLVLLGIIEL